MAAVITSPPADTKAMLNHAWLLEDQKVAFGHAPFVAKAASVSSHLSGDNYTLTQVKSGLYIEDSQITVCLMNQALEFLQRAMGNTVAHYMLAKKGLETWARVTNYYASYFSVHGLLCLQGRTITRLQLDKTTLVQVVPVDLRRHVFGITRYTMRNPHHEAPWKRFYDIYDRYAVSHQAYETVARKAHITDPTDESIERNSINYTPFVGFNEVQDLNRHQEFTSLFEEYLSALEGKATLEEFLSDLQGYATDPECKYFARTLLRLALAGDILLALREASDALEEAWASMTRGWENFLRTIFAEIDNCYLLRFIPLIGTRHELSPSTG